ncbi:MAG: type II secretion system F family protein [Deltaproteobacteria bacterium]
MALYKYKVKKNREILKGFEEGSINEIRKRFIDDGYAIIMLEEVRGRVGLGASSGFKRRISNGKLTEFCSQFAILIEAGMNVSKSIEILENNEMNTAFKSVLNEIKTEINKGISLSESVKNRKNQFPEIFVMALKTGEYSGNMAGVLKEMAEYFEKIDKNSSKLIGICAYPAVLVLFLFINLIVMSIKVVPVFKEVFSEYEKALPWSTKAVFLIADFIKNNYVLLIILIVLSIVLMILGPRNKKVKNALDILILKIPIINQLVIDTSVGSFLKSLSLLLKSNMTLIESLEPAINTIGNNVVRNSIKKDTSDILTGKPFYELIHDNRYIKNIAKTLIETGENSAQLEETVEKAVEYYDRHLEKRMDLVARLIEPIFILVLGIIIAFVVISMALPIFKISSGSIMK